MTGTGRTPFQAVWLAVYAGVARAGAAYLTRGERGASTYARAGFGTDDFLPGLSDVDLAIVLASDAARPGAASARARRRWARLDRRLPVARLLLDWPRIYEEEELRDLAGDTVFTYGLADRAEPGADRAAYGGGRGDMDTMRMLERPGLYGPAADWRLLRGPERRPAAAGRDPQETRIAAWLELVYWWRLVFDACVDPGGPHTSTLCVKLVAEPARIWLWLAHRERVESRADALARAIGRLPEEEEALRRALAWQRALPRSADAPLAEALPALMRLSSRIARLIADEVEAEGSTGVRLLGTDPPRLIGAEGAHPPAGLPLCDWRALAFPPPPDESFVPLPGDPGDPAVLAEATAAQRGRSYGAFRAGGIMVLAAPGHPLERTRQRAIKCPASDPASFALAEGSRIARFPNVRGWSAADTARRAVAEHRARLL